MKTFEINHPLVKQKLSVLRNEKTSFDIFRKTTDEISILLSVYATNNIELKSKNIKTPITTTKGFEFKKPLPIVVPILRAGFGMLNGFLKVFPECVIGFLGMKRNEETLDIDVYAEKLPNNLKNRKIIIIDPMLATGHSLVRSLKYFKNKKVDSVDIITILSARQGIEEIEKIEKEMGFNITLWTGKIDKKLNKNHYIVPGLGDAGDRIFGYID